MDEFEHKLTELLTRSTISAARYKPSQEIRSLSHSAVLLDGKPIYLCGPSDNEASVQQSKELADSITFKRGLVNAGLLGELGHGTIQGAEIDWNCYHTAIVQSKSGVYEQGNSERRLLGINLTSSEPLSIYMCVDSGIAKIIDPNCPDLDDVTDILSWS